jgi:hypothetical protein
MRKNHVPLFKLYLGLSTFEAAPADQIRGMKKDG